MVSLDFFTLIGIASFSLQLAVLGLVLYGYGLKRKLQFRRHGIVMAAATLLHLALVLVIMIPSFVYAVVPDYIIPSPLMLLSLVGLIHGVTGSITIALGVWLVWAWRLRANFTGCIKNKKLMKPTLILWLISLSFGILLFALFYGPALLG